MLVASEANILRANKALHGKLALIVFQQFLLSICDTWMVQWAFSALKLLELEKRPISTMSQQIELELPNLRFQWYVKSDQYLKVLRLKVQVVHTVLAISQDCFLIVCLYFEFVE